MTTLCSFYKELSKGIGVELITLLSQQIFRNNNFLTNCLTVYHKVQWLRVWTRHYIGDVRLRLVSCLQHMHEHIYLTKISIMSPERWLRLNTLKMDFFKKGSFSIWGIWQNNDNNDDDTVQRNWLHFHALCGLFMRQITLAVHLSFWTTVTVHHDNRFIALLVHRVSFVHKISFRKPIQCQFITINILIHNLSFYSNEIVA